MKAIKLQEMATKFYLESVSIAKNRKEKLISINSNYGFIKLRRVLNLLKKEKIEASFETFMDFRKKQNITFKTIA